MTGQSWHTEFNPQKFLSRVDLDSLIERNVTYNEASVLANNSACIFCKEVQARGILLNDKSFLCQNCYIDISKISYPERYESQRRQFLLASQARKLAWESFRQRFEHHSEESSVVFFGWASVLLALINPAFLLLTIGMLIVGYDKNSTNKRKLDEWLALKSSWEQENPEPPAPDLKHFHDPEARLSHKDLLVLKVFYHWPGYPPFWKYLRSVVVARDSNRCQVTGCPSRLELHVHHITPVSMGGRHSPDNLISLCDFHHALEPEQGHERIWSNIKTRYFTLVRDHERANRASDGTHSVQTHLRRLQLVTLPELHELSSFYGFCCPKCNSQVSLSLLSAKSQIRAECSNCNSYIEGPQQLTEESGPLLAEVLVVSKNKGKWKARWDMLAERKSNLWGTWHSRRVVARRRAHRENVDRQKAAPVCPKCGAPMRVKRPWKPTHTWAPFWGCTQYDVSGCKGSAKYIGE